MGAVRTIQQGELLVSFSLPEHQARLSRNAATVEEEAQQLSIYAEFTGEWRDIEVGMQPGVWVAPKDAIGVLVNPSQWVVDAYVEQRQVERIQVGANATFYPQQQLTGVAATVAAIDTVNSQQLPYAQLADKYGGKIAVQAHQQGIVPKQSLFRVRLRLAEPLAALHESSGQVQITGEPKSLLWSGGKKLLSILIRESGF